MNRVVVEGRYSLGRCFERRELCFGCDAAKNLGRRGVLHHTHLDGLQGVRRAVNTGRGQHAGAPDGKRKAVAEGFGPFPGERNAASDISLSGTDAVQAIVHAGGTDVAHVAQSCLTADLIENLDRKAFNAVSVGLNKRFVVFKDDSLQGASS